MSLVLTVVAFSSFFTSLSLSLSLSLSIFIYIYMYIYILFSPFSVLLFPIFLFWPNELSVYQQIERQGVQSLVESYGRLKKWYLMPPCLTLSIIRYGSRIKWSHPGKGIALSPTLQHSIYWQESPFVPPRLRLPTLLLYICIYIYICLLSPVCVYSFVFAFLLKNISNFVGYLMQKQSLKVCLFNGISTFVGYLMPSPFSQKNCSGTI